MKGAAWDAPVAAWPEAKEVSQDDVDAFSDKFGVGRLT
jgi:hypothetical protein